MSDPKASTRYTGAVYTPAPVARAIVKRCSSLLGSRELRVLEPSVGDGAFLSELIGLNSPRTRITAVDIDCDVIRELKRRYHNQSDDISFVQGDFIRFAIDRKYNGDSDEEFDLIIGNPPFIRRHNFSAEMKEGLKDFSAAFDYPLSRLKNTWTAFLLAATGLVSSNGVVALVLPYEVLTVDYGQKVLNHIQSEFVRIEIIVSSQKAFPEIDQDAIILIAEKESMKDPGLYVTKVPDFGDLNDFDARKTDFMNGAQGGIELNSYLLPPSAVKTVKDLQAKSTRISDYLTSAPGVVSAANDFFIRKRTEVEQLGLSEYAKPILKKGSFSSSSPVFTLREFEALAEREPCFLLHLNGDRDQLSSAAQAYIKVGEDQGIHQRYKCRKRPNWYQVPLVENEEAFVFKRSHSHPRVLLNGASVHTTDTAYGLRLLEGFTARGFCFSFYTSPTMLFAEMNGRFYGGGVLELSPNEFRGLAFFYHEPTDEEFADFLHAHHEADGQIEAVLDFGDQWLISNGYLGADELAVIRQSWRTIRAHRMRHGGRQSIA